MARAKSPRFREAAQSVSASESPLILLELRHALLAEPLRFVNDVQDLVCQGHNFVAGQFGFTGPDDADKKTPNAQLRIANARGDVGSFFERTHGGRGATMRVLQVMRSAPDVLEDDLVLDLTNVEVDAQAASGQLGYEDVLNKPGTAYTYRPETAPGMF